MAVCRARLRVAVARLQLHVFGNARQPQSIGFFCHRKSPVPLTTIARATAVSPRTPCAVAVHGADTRGARFRLSGPIAYAAVNPSVCGRSCDGESSGRSATTTVGSARTPLGPRTTAVFGTGFGVAARNVDVVFLFLFLFCCFLLLWPCCRYGINMVFGHFGTKCMRVFAGCNSRFAFWNVQKQRKEIRQRKANTDKR